MSAATSASCRDGRDADHTGVGNSPLLPTPGSETKNNNEAKCVVNKSVVDNVNLLRIKRTQIMLDMDTISNLEPDSSTMDEMWRAVDCGSAEMLQAALDAGADINGIHPKENETVLQYAVIGRRAMRRSVAMLIAAGADVNAADRHGRTPLMFAVGKYANYWAAAQLVEGGADVNARDEGGCTALMKARRADAIKLLIAAGADVNAADECGYTALHHLASSGEGALLLKLLIDAGADANARCKDGSTALILAADQFCSSDPLRVLLEAGAEVNAANAYGTTALSVATTWHCNERPRKLLLEAGADDSKKIVAGDATFYERRCKEMEAKNPGYAEFLKKVQDALNVLNDDDEEPDFE